MASIHIAFPLEGVVLKTVCPQVAFPGAGYARHRDRWPAMQEVRVASCVVMMALLSDGFVAARPCWSALLWRVRVPSSWSSLVGKSELLYFSSIFI
jgi:hypothetical protein